MEILEREPRTFPEHPPVTGVLGQGEIGSPDLSHGVLLCVMKSSGYR
jgi:hypothetical protein